MANERDASQRVETARKNPKFHKESPLEGGWILIEHIRNGPSRSQHIDRYWFSPKTKRRFRSKTERERFIVILDEVDGKDEDQAWKIFKETPKKRKKSAIVSTSTASKNSDNNNADAAATPKKTNRKGNRSKKIQKDDRHSSGTTARLMDKDECCSNGSDYEDDIEVGKVKTPKPLHEFSFGGRTSFSAIKEAKQVMLAPEERNEFLFAEAVATAVDERQYRMTITKPDPCSAFDFQKDLLFAEPKDNHRGHDGRSKPKKKRMKKTDMKEAKSDKIQKTSHQLFEKLNAQSK